MIRNIVAVATALQHLLCADAFAFFPPPSLAHTLEHLFSPPPSLKVTPLEELTNIRIPGSSNNEILAYKATPSDKSKQYTTANSIILIHEFFGLNPSIIEKAQALSKGCTVIAPDTFRGEVTSFIPKAIWLAISTPQKRVNEDLNHVCAYLEKENGKEGQLAVMGFCYGGGKAIRYTTQCNQDAATVVFYGSPVIDVNELKKLKAPVCGVYGKDDAQFPRALLDKFQIALDEANLLMMYVYMMVLDMHFGKIWNRLREGNSHKLMLMNNVFPFLENTLVEMRYYNVSLNKLIYPYTNEFNNSFIKWIRVLYFLLQIHSLRLLIVIAYPTTCLSTYQYQVHLTLQTKVLKVHGRHCIEQSTRLLKLKQLIILFHLPNFGNVSFHNLFFLVHQNNTANTC